MAFQPIPKPKSNLGYLRILAPTAGVRVSPLCLGAMNFGDAWKGFMGECDKKSSFEILDFFYENGELPNIILADVRRINMNCATDGDMQVATSSTRQTTTRLKRARPGSVNGWLPARTEMR